MTEISLNGSIISLLRCNNAANILVVDRDNPQNAIFKVALWDSDAETVFKNADKGDEISVTGKVYCVETNKYGHYIDLRMCKLNSITKIQRTKIQCPGNEAAEEKSQPQKGE